jgi:formylglycine-generating enzyme required for sulfatase activity
VAPVFSQEAIQQPPSFSTTAPIAASSSPEDEFRRLLMMSRLCIDGDDMTDDQRDAMCNMGESLGLTGGQAEDLIDEYLEKAAVMPQPTTTPTARLPKTPASPPAPMRLASGEIKSGAPKTATQNSAQLRPPLSGVKKEPQKELNLTPAGRTMERQKYLNFTNSISAEMLLVPSGQFMMGSDQPESQANEQPITPVKLACFYMSRFPVTNVQYEQFDAAHRSKRAPWADENHPVVYVSWKEAEAFCKWLSQREGRRYRLPTEAEWEYAARGDEGNQYPWGARLNAGNLANFADARSNFVWRDPAIDDGFAETSPVGSYPLGASPFGIEEMSGNAFEWCLDLFDVYKGKVVVNPCNTKFGQQRVYRGGSWKSRAASLRACSRNSNIPTYLGNDVGFRVVCECD